MEIIINETNFISVTAQTNYIVNKYNICYKIINKMSAIKGLDIIFLDKLSFQQPVETIIVDSRKLIGYIQSMI